MSRKGKIKDPKLIALMDAEAKLAIDFDRWFTRMKRALGQLDKLRRALKHIGRKIEDFGKASDERK